MNAGRDGAPWGGFPEIVTGVPRQKFRTDINALRALSVAIVVGFHFAEGQFRGGFIGVDVFFVISGFLMTQILLKYEAQNIGIIFSFIKARLVRIYPALITTLIISVLLSYILIDPIQQQRIMEESTYASAFVSNIFYYHHTNYFEPSSIRRWMLHTWSLSVEWQFYVLYPIAVFLTARILGKKYLIHILLLIFFASFFLCSFYRSAGSVANFYLLPFRAWEMAAGGIVQLMGVRTERKWVSIAGFLAILVLSFVIDSRQPWPSALTLLPVAAAFAILAARWDLWTVPGYGLVHRVGLYSYSIYLWHWPILSYLRYLHPNLSLADIGIGVVGSFIAGGASYHLIERPTQRLLRPRRFSVVLGISATLAAVTFVVPLPQPDLVFRMAKAYGADTGFWHTVLDRDKEAERKSNDCDGTLANGDLRVCRYSGRDPSGTKALVVGDSHAGMWIPRFEQLASTPAGAGIASVSLVLRHGCPLVPGINNGWRTCAQFNDKAFALAESGRFDHVLFVSVWDYFPNRVGDLCVVEPDGCVRKNERAIFQEKIGQFLERVRRLSDRGIRVTIVLPPPFSAYDVPVELSRRRFLSLDRHDVETLPRPVQDKKRAVETAALRQLDGVPGITFLDPFDLFCDADRCRVVDDAGHPLFTDSNHWGAAYTAASPFLDKGLK